MSSYAYQGLLPHRLSIACPDCGREASFEFAERVRIKRRADVAWFEASDDFDDQVLPDGNGQNVNVATYYHGLKGLTPPEISDLPEGYALSDWDHSRARFRSANGFQGTLSCAGCTIRRKHELDWPSEAYFQIDYRGHVLWAFDRESAVELCAYIGSSHRDASHYTYWSFLMKIPRVFLTKGARETVVRRLKKRLEGRC